MKRFLGLLILSFFCTSNVLAGKSFQLVESFWPGDVENKLNASKIYCNVSSPNSDHTLKLEVKRGEALKKGGCHDPHIVFGPYKNYSTGRYKVEYILKSDDFNNEVNIAEIDIHDANSHEILVKKDIASRALVEGEWSRFVLEFTIINPNNSMEFRVKWLGEAHIQVATINLFKESDFYIPGSQNESDVQQAVQIRDRYLAKKLQQIEQKAQRIVKQTALAQSNKEEKAARRQATINVRERILSDNQRRHNDVRSQYSGSDTNSRCSATSAFTVN